MSYKSGESSELLQVGGWQDDQGNETSPNLLIFEVTASLENKLFVVDIGFVCQAAGESSGWIVLNDNQRCDSTLHCHSGTDEELACKQVLVTGSKGKDGVTVTTIQQVSTNSKEKRIGSSK